MEWTNLKTQEEIENFLKFYNDFMVIEAYEIKWKIIE